MSQKLTWRNSGTWAVISLGLAMTGYWLVTWLFAVWRARAGSIDLDTMAASTALSIKGLVAGLVILAIGVVARLVLKPKMQPTR